VTGDPPTETSQEPLASCDAAFSCLLQLGGRSGGNEVGALHCRNVVNGETLSISRLIELAGDLGLKVEHAQLDWQRLQALGFSRPILVLLKNSNVIMLTGGGRDGTSEVAVWDPLDPYGEILFVTREKFERACTGHALIITPPPSTGVEPPPSLDFCWFTSAGLELLGKTSAKGQDPKLSVQGRGGAGTHPKPTAPGMPRRTDKANAPAIHSEFAHVRPGIVNEELPPDTGADARLSTPALTHPPAQRRLSPPVRFYVVAGGILAAASIATFLLRNSATGPIAAALALANEVWAVAPHSARSTDQAMQRETARSIDSISQTGSALLPARPVATPAAAPDVAAPSATPPAGAGFTAPLSPPSAMPDLTKPSDELAVPPAEPVAPSLAAAPSAPPNERDVAVPSAEPGLAMPDTTPDTKAASLSASTSGPQLSAAELAALVARGDTLLSAGDVASARLLYEHAADAGEGLAAIRLGETFDPLFLGRVHLSGVRGDPGAALFWYRRARSLGATDAEVLLKALEAK